MVASRWPVRTERCAASSMVSCTATGRSAARSRQKDGTSPATPIARSRCICMRMLGGDFVHQLRGEFAVVIADQRRRSLIAVRDRFGIKPLFYTVQGGDVLVASEIKALLALGAPARWETQRHSSPSATTSGPRIGPFSGRHPCSCHPAAPWSARDGQVEIQPYLGHRLPQPRGPRRRRTLRGRHRQRVPGSAR